MAQRIELIFESTKSQIWDYYEVVFSFFHKYHSLNIKVVARLNGEVIIISAFQQNKQHLLRETKLSDGFWDILHFSNFSYSTEYNVIIYNVNSLYFLLFEAKIFPSVLLS